MQFFVNGMIAVLLIWQWADFGSMGARPIWMKIIWPPVILLNIMAATGFFHYLRYM